MTASLQTPLGEMTAFAQDKGLYYLGFADCIHASYVKQAPQQSSGHAQTYLTQIKEEITAYFQGSKKSFQTPLVFSGTAFQQDTWRALECIPYGVKWTYTDLAEAIHKPKAVRAAASASKKNPFMVAIPCHRVLYKSGNMGGYSGGPERKKWLLAHETKYTNF